MPLLHRRRAAARPWRRLQRGGSRPAWSVRGLVLVLLLGGAAECVVETEPAPPKRLLRDLPPRPAPPLPSASAGATSALAVPRSPADASPPSIAPPEPAASREPPPVPESFRTCQADSDCDAVLKNGCCRDGRNEAINKASAAAYKTSFTCPVPHPICPMHLVVDRRVPACDVTAHACTLVPGPAPAR